MIVANQRVSAHFLYSEVRCKCGERCDGGHCRWEVLALAEEGRAEVSRVLGIDCPHTVGSGVRCEPWNLEKGGTRDSLHLKGLALDLYTPGLWLSRGREFEEWADLWESVVGDRGGFGRYPNWKNRMGVQVGGVHIDARGFRARW